MTADYEQIIITGQLHDDIMHAGKRRNDLCRQWGQKDKRHVGKNSLAWNQQGLFAEVAVGIQLDIEWDWWAEFRPGGHDNDVNGIQVRSTAGHDRKLLTLDNDIPGPYVLVTIARVHPQAVECRIHGWAPLDECNVDAHRTVLPSGDVGYLTPKTALHPIDTLTTTTCRRDA